MRNESIPVYYSCNTFRVVLEEIVNVNCPYSWKMEDTVRGLKAWAATEGAHSAPHLRSLHVFHSGGHYPMSLHIDLKNDLIQPVRFDPKGLGEVCFITWTISKSNLDALVIAVMQQDGKLVRTTETISHLIVALQLISCWPEIPEWVRKDKQAQVPWLVSEAARYLRMEDQPYNHRLPSPVTRWSSRRFA